MGTKMQPQQTGYMGMQMPGMQPQMTGFNHGAMSPMSPMGQMGQMGQMGMQPQQTGFGGAGGHGFNQFGQQGVASVQSAQQMMAQQTGFGMGSQQQVQQQQQQQQQQEDKDKFNASNIFQQMKSGSFAKDPNAAPQTSDKYDALRPQPTGFQPGGVMPQFTGMGYGQQQQQ